MSLRELVYSHQDSEWFKANQKNIDFELNHLELHDLDGYLLSMHNKGIKAEKNPNNSNIAYLIGITQDEPQEAIRTVGGSFPDIDLDFEHERRDEVFNHLIEKYGKDHFAHIGIFGFTKARGIFKDVARIYDLDFKTSNELSKLIPDLCESLGDALAESPDLKEKYDNDKEIKEIIDYARNLEGCIKSVGIHACLAGDSKILTDRGYKKLSELVNKDFEVLTSNGFYPATCQETGVKKIYRLPYAKSKYSKNKNCLFLTSEHKVNTKESGWVEAKDAYGLTLANGVDNESVHPELVLAGWMWNDGSFSRKNNVQDVFFTPEKDDEAVELFTDMISSCKDRVDRFRVNHGTLNRINSIYGENYKINNYKGESPDFSSLNTREIIGWLKGFFSANATVQRGCIRLKITSEKLLKSIQYALNDLEIDSSIQKIPGKFVDWKNGRYFTKDSYVLELSVNPSFKFNQVIGFVQKYKSEKICEMKFFELEEVGLEAVYDFTVATIHEDTKNGFIDGVQVHNCGVAISDDKPITDYVPLFESKGFPVTQFDGPTLEKIGLIKYDILGLKNLTVISKTLDLIKKIKGEKILPEDIPIDCPEAFGLISEMNSLGVFQIEGSQKLREFAAACKPESIEDLAAIISLYRPGPMGMGYLEQYIGRKSGAIPPKFVLPDYGYIFEKTYGLMIYQEQLNNIGV